MREYMCICARLCVSLFPIYACVVWTHLASFWTRRWKRGLDQKKTLCPSYLMIGQFIIVLTNCRCLFHRSMWEMWRHIKTTALIGQNKFSALTFWEYLCYFYSERYHGIPWIIALYMCLAHRYVFCKYLQSGFLQMALSIRLTVPLMQHFNPE